MFYLTHSDFYFIVVLGMAALLSIGTRKLTTAGGIIGGVIALLIYGGAGYYGIAMLGTFFLLSVIATCTGRNEKKKKGFAEENKGQRTAWQVCANGGIAAIAGSIALLHPPYHALMQLAIAGSLAAATADTLSSELGMIYGSRFYNILTLQKDKCGKNGVISLEGTLAGIIGSALIALIYGIGSGWDTIVWIIIAGIIGNLADSLLGATLERKGIMGNNAVNAINTLTGAVVAMLPGVWF